MADTAMSKRLEIRPGIRPLKSMSTHSTFLPMAAATASTNSTSKPVRLPLSTYSMGGKVASVATCSTSVWALAAPCRPARLLMARVARRSWRRKFMGQVLSGWGETTGGDSGRTRLQSADSRALQRAGNARCGDQGHVHKGRLAAIDTQGRCHQGDGTVQLALAIQQGRTHAPDTGIDFAG